MPVKHSALVVIFVLGLVALFATRCAAQAPATPMLSAVQAEAPTPRGQLGVEIAGGSIGLAMGSVLTYSVLHSHGTCGGGHTPTFCDLGGLFITSSLVLLAAPGLTSAGVLLAGNESGGNGKLGKTLLGAYLGGFGGAVLGGMVSRDASGQGDSRVVFPIGALGMVSGAVLAYRSSSARAAAPSLNAMLDRRGAMLSLSGAL